MNLDDFQRLFGDSIRALVSWGELRAAEAAVAELVITDRASLGRLRTVWYRDRDGGVGDWRDPRSVPQSVAGAVEHREMWTPDRRERIAEFRREYQRHTEPVVLAVPAYATPAGSLLLDSTHRAVAAYLSKVEVRLLVLSIIGPISSEILPDLSHHSAPVEDNLDV